jgi:hypothetical protein
MSTLNLPLAVFPKPLASAETEYCPGGIERNKYRPLLSDVVLKV